MYKKFLKVLGISRLKACLVILLVAGGWLLTASSPVTAQQITKLTAIPPRLELKVDPGETKQDVLRLRNNGDSEMAVEIKVEDFVVSDSKGTPVPVDKKVSGRWAASSWIQVSPSKFIIKPGETKQLDLVVVAPDDALPGGHYAVVFYRPSLGGEAGQTASLTTPNVGSLLYITVPGVVEENAFVSRLEMPQLSEYGPVDITAEVENLSDIHIRPLGTIKIYNWLGKLDTTLKLEEKNIFPGSSRVYENRWPTQWGFGRYKAQLEAGYGTKGQVLTAVTFFWVLPYRLMATIGLSLLVIILLLVYVRKRDGGRPSFLSRSGKKKKDDEPYSED